MHDLACKILQEESKDLEVGTYLVEALGADSWFRRSARRFSGLPMSD